MRIENHIIFYISHHTYTVKKMSTPPGFFFRFTQDGEPRRVRLYSTTSDWSKDIHISDDEKKVTLCGNQQLRFSTDDLKDYVHHSLLNTRVSWTADLSRVKKSWNCALYTTDLHDLLPPAYLDAQSWDSRTEMDFMEANMIAYHYTAHRAGDRPGNLIMGLGGSVQYNPNQKFRSDQTSLPPEELYGNGKYINTQHPFRCSVTHTDKSVRLELVQDDRCIYNESQGGAYLSSFLENLKSQTHVFIMSLWTGNMGWLDDGVGGSDDRIIDVRATISDLEITSLCATTSSS